MWDRLAVRFGPGDRVLELNCGTGEDAVFLARLGVHVTATDLSPAMVEATRAKADAAGVGDRVRAAVVAIEDIGGFDACGDGPFDGVLSNFGGLNCVADRRAAGRALAPLVRPGGAALACVMGPVVPWEWAWFVGHRQPREAVRRLGGPASWRGIEIRYPSARRLHGEWAPWFVAQRCAALGALLPPPYAEAWASRHPRLIERLDRWERRVETRAPMTVVADHYLSELVRR